MRGEVKFFFAGHNQSGEEEKSQPIIIFGQSNSLLSLLFQPTAPHPAGYRQSLDAFSEANIDRLDKDCHSRSPSMWMEEPTTTGSASSSASVR